ncbi:hypothetical protein CC80DRAFT_54735 [Byssothecium circinans]|uniref:Uncharacterized protein n=1 Tax=Byssothecium circinans TaxID=147558 RepID=A0A6A5TYH3_9PLEO|nr:hypothetical protein CC80DRAFT_54735 [Byssothecium circinans]
MKSRPAARIGLMMASEHSREVLRLGQGYSTKIWSDKDLTLALWGGRSATPRKKALYKSGSEATMRS